MASEVEFKSLSQMILEAMPDDCWGQYQPPRVQRWHDTYKRRAMAMRRVRRRAELMMQIRCKQREKGSGQSG